MQPNYGEAYASVGKLVPFRYIESLAAGLGLATNHVDAVAILQNPEVDDPDLYLVIPKGWDSGGGNGSEKTLKPQPAAALEYGKPCTD